MFERKIKKEYLDLAKIVYGGEFYFELTGYKQKELNIDNTKFQKVTDTLLKQRGITDYFCYKSDSGLGTSLFEKIENDKLVIAYRGTERLGLGENVSDIVSFIRDVISDTNLLTGNVDAQFIDAWEFYKLVRKQNPKSEIILTGQSLGGALAQIVSAKEYTVNRRKLEAHTFNAPGCSHLLDAYDCYKKYNYPFITNYSVMNDWCGMYGEHIGKRYLISPIEFKDVDKNNQTEVINNVLLTTHEGIFEYFNANIGSVIRKPKDFNQQEGLALWYFDDKNPLKEFKTLSEYLSLNFQGFNFSQNDFINETMDKAKKFIEDYAPEFIKKSEFASAIKTASDSFVQTQTEQTEKVLEDMNNNTASSALGQLDLALGSLTEDDYKRALKIVKRRNADFMGFLKFWQ